MVEAELVLGTQEWIAVLLATWLPALEQTNEDDARWNWPSKGQDPCFPNLPEHVMLVQGGRVQGMMLTTVPETPGPPLSSLADLVYIEYLATAPWNRPSVVTVPEFRGVGPQLIRHAVNRSTSMSRGGRIGLHSEPGAVAFYDKLELKNCGEDLDQDLRHYFEGDDAWAARFISREEPRP